MSECIRTLHIDTEAGWRGGEQQAMNLMRGLAARGHPVACACRPGSATDQACRAQGIEVCAVAMRSEADVAAALNVRRFARAYGAQILHAHTAHAHAIAAAAAWRLPACRCVVSRRVDFAVGGNPLSRLKYRFGVDRYIAISHAVRDVLTAGGVDPRKISVVHSGIDLARFEVPVNAGLRSQLGIPAAAPVVGNIAALVDHKGHKYLIDAVPAVLERRPDAWFVIAGDGELRDRLKRRAADRGVAGRVLFVGFRKDVPDLLNLFDVFVMSSHMEGLCTSLLDAMAMGVPIVATRAGGIPEIVRDGVNGLLVETKAPAALAEGIVKLLDDRDLAAGLAEAARSRVERDFSAGAMVEKTLSVYREVLACGD